MTHLNKIYPDRVKSYLALALIFAAALILTACNSDTSQANIKGTEWTLVSYGDVNNPTPAAAGVETLLSFGKDGQVSGSMGCNSFGGDYSIKGDKITFGSLISTMMACDEPRMTQEGAAFALMNMTVRYAAGGNTLTIFSADEKSVLNLTSK
jgi:heat shock protein HslJ